MSIVKPFFFWPMSVSGGPHFNFKVAGVPVAITVPAASMYSPEDLRAALETAIVTQYPLASAVVTVSESGLLTISAGTAFDLQITDGAFGQQFGWYGGAYQSSTLISGTHYLAANFQMSNAWYPSVAPLFDSLDFIDASQNLVTRAVSGKAKHIVENQVINREWKFSYLAPAFTYETFEGTALNTAYERFWKGGYARFKYFPDATSVLNSVEYMFDNATLKEFKPKRLYLQKALYEINLKAFRYV